MPNANECANVAPFGRDLCRANQNDVESTTYVESWLLVKISFVLSLLKAVSFTQIEAFAPLLLSIVTHNALRSTRFPLRMSGVATMEWVRTVGAQRLSPSIPIACVCWNVYMQGKQRTVQTKKRSADWMVAITVKIWQQETPDKKRALTLCTPRSNATAVDCTCVKRSMRRRRGGEEEAGTGAHERSKRSRVEERSGVRTPLTSSFAVFAATARPTPPTTPRLVLQAPWRSSLRSSSTTTRPAPSRRRAQLRRCRIFTRSSPSLCDRPPSVRRCPRSGTSWIPRAEPCRATWRAI